MKRKTLLSVLLLVSLGIFFGAHVYLAQRLVVDPRLPAPWYGLGLGVFAFLGASVILGPLSERRGYPRVALFFQWPASIWIGLSFLLLTLVAASDLILALLGSTALADPGQVVDPQGPARLQALLVGGLGVAVAAWALRGGLKPPELRRVDLRLERWPAALDGFRIAQISDIHISSLRGRSFARRLVGWVNGLDADLVVVTGDLVDGKVERLREEVTPLAGLRARHGVYFVTGNHDHMSGASSWAAEVEGLGWRPLRNTRVRIGDGESSFDLAGVDDHHGSMMHRDGGEDLPRALDERDPRRPVVLLAHDPATFKSASQMGVDLQISGHTHGGQIWPFVYLVRLVTPFVAGLYRRNGSQLYVSRGTGFWGSPMRLFAPAEITEISLRRIPAA